MIEIGILLNPVIVFVYDTEINDLRKNFEKALASVERISTYKVIENFQFSMTL